MDDLNLSFGKEYLNEYNILKYKKTQEELKESTEELLEFGFFKKIEKKINDSNSLKNGFHIQLDKINNDDYVLGFLLYDKGTKCYPS